MSNSPFAGFAAPAAPSAPAPPGNDDSFVLPEDPNWEPMNQDTVLAQDGYYCGKVISEKRNGDNFIITFEIQDADARGSTLSKFLKDPRVSPKIVGIWRGMLMSMAGKAQARAQFGYTLGSLSGQLAYFKTEPYEDRTSIGAFVAAEEYNSAVAQGKHRWPRKEKAATGMGVAPLGLPNGTPGFGVVPQPAAGLSGTPTPAAIPQPAPAATVFPAGNGPPVAPPAPAAVPQPAGSPFAFPRLAKQ